MAAAQADRPQWLQELVAEQQGTRNQVYLLSLSRLLAETLAAAAGTLRSLETLTRQQLLGFVRNSFEEPETVAGRGARPRVSENPLVRKLVAVCEQHADGSWHFHVAVLLYRPCRFEAVKRALRVRHKLAAHFSCTHREWWSALRYLTHTTKKKLEVDGDREVWLAENESFNAFKESQEPWCAKAWRAKREKRDMNAAADDAPMSFTKLDFTSLVISERLQTRAAVLRYVQKHGTDAMRIFVSRNQKRLDEFLSDAKEWQDAQRVAEEEELTDWALVCRAAGEQCLAGNACPYYRASEEILNGNASNWDRQRLAAALRSVIVSGPSKDTRVPFLVGGTNTGKSTLVDPFDDLFGFERVFHIPALSDGKYALSNWVADKRFVYWDECDPVEMAEKGILPATVFKKAFGGQWFEIQRAQNWHDGNKDWRWRRGVVFTNKWEGLWRTTPTVTAEDIRHMQSRVEQFHFTHQVVPPGRRPPRGNIEPCHRHMAQWIVNGAAGFDAAQVVALMPPAGEAEAEGETSGESVAELAAFFESVKLPPRAVDVLSKDIVATGAVHVQELTREDWEGLPSWASLKPMERRRVLTRVPP